MELHLHRHTRTEHSTIGDLSIDGIFQCFILEDKDRGLRQTMPLTEIKRIKIKHETCIPAGRYKVGLRYSPKHDAIVPYLIDVPGFEYIEMHPGNTKVDTDGCLLPGLTRMKDFVGDSRKAYAALLAKITPAIKAGTCYITID